VKVALLFPGQGAQKPGMGKEFVDISSSARAVFEKANEVLGFDIARLCFEGPEEELIKTINTQPALFVTEIAALEALKERVGEIGNFVAGHSIGEYSAVVASGALTFEDGLRLVKTRARLMQDAALDYPAEGSMAAIMGDNLEIVNSICREVQEKMGKVCQIANWNSPQQVVISGDKNAIEEAISLLKKGGIKKVIPLKVNAAFHTPLMQKAANLLKQVINDINFSTPRIPLVNNLRGKIITTGEGVKNSLLFQMDSPVLWDKIMDSLLSVNVDYYIELGVGKVLTGLFKKKDKTVKIFNVEDKDTLMEVSEFLNKKIKEME